MNTKKFWKNARPVLSLKTGRREEETLSNETVNSWFSPILNELFEVSTLPRDRKYADRDIDHYIGSLFTTSETIKMLGNYSDKVLDNIGKAPYINSWKSGPTPFIIPKGRITPLMRAILRNDLDKVVEIVDNDPGSVNEEGFHGFTPLVFAVALGNPDIIWAVLDSPADIELRRVFTVKEALPREEFTVFDMLYWGQLSHSKNINIETVKGVCLDFYEKCRLRDCEDLQTLSVLAMKKNGNFYEHYDKERGIIQ